MATDVFKLRFIGNNVKPESFSLRNLFSLLLAAEESLLSEISNEASDIASSIRISLNKIEHGSAAYSLSTNFPEPFQAGATRLIDAVNNQVAGDITPKSRRFLKLVQNASRSHMCDVEIYDRPRIKRRPPTIITPETELDLDYPASIFGSTTLSGKVVRLGGAEPKVRIEFDDGQALSCEIEVSLLKKMGPQLYDWVSVSGKAQWHNKTHQLLSFKVESFEPIEVGESLLEGLKKIRAAGGSAWDDVEDVPEFIRGLRGGED